MRSETPSCAERAGEGEGMNYEYIRRETYRAMVAVCCCFGVLLKVLKVKNNEIQNEALAKTNF